MKASPKLVASALVVAAFIISVGAASRHVVAEHDFAVRYAAGVAVRSGHNPYDAFTIGGRLFLDPPPVAMLFAAVSELPYRAAAWLWFGSSVAASIGIAWLTASVLRVRLTSRVDLVAVGALGLAFGPLRYGVAGVQLDPILALAGMGVLALSVRRRRGEAVGALAVLGALKPQLGLLPMTATVERSRRAVVASLVTGIALVGLTALVVPSATWPHWVHAVRHSPRNTSDAQVLLALGFVATAGLWFWARRSLTNELLAFSAAATLGVNAFALVHLNPFSAILLIVPCALVIRAALRVDTSATRQYATAVVAGALAAGAVAPATVYGGAHAAFFPVATATALAAAAAIYLPRARPMVAVAYAVNVVAVVSSLTPSTTRLLVAAASVGLAWLLTTER